MYVEAANKKQINKSKYKDYYSVRPDDLSAVLRDNRHGFNLSDQGQTDNSTE